MVAFIKRLMTKFGHNKNTDNQPSGFTDGDGNMLTVAELMTATREARKKWLSGFGYKMCWYMLKEQELQAPGWTLTDLANAINLENQHFLSWNDGIEFVYTDKDSGKVFITPSLDGWIYVLNFTDELDLLEGVLNNYYAFGSYRVADYASWRQVKHGQTVRYFQYGDGVVYQNIGTQTEEEAKLGFMDITGLDNEQACEAMFTQAAFDNPDIVNIPDEEDVMALCKAWTQQTPDEFEHLPIITVNEQGVAGVLNIK